MDIHGWNGKDFEGRFCHFSVISIAKFTGSALLRDVQEFERTKVLSIAESALKSLSILGKVAPSVHSAH
jgi:hypothetical protein